MRQIADTEVMHLFKLTFDLELSRIVVLVYQPDEASAIQHAQRKLLIDKEPEYVIKVPQEPGIVFMTQSAQPRHDD